MQDEQSHSASTQETGTAPSLWNPAALANWSLLLTPLFGSYLLAENYKAMGKPKEAKKAMEWFYLGIAIFLSVFLLSPSGLFGVALLTYLLYLVSWNFMSARKQQRAVLSEYGKTYERQPWGKVLAIGIAAIIVWQIIVRAPSSNVTSSLFPTTSFDSAEVKRVKSGVMQLCPSHTVDQMVKGFMGSPSWKSGKSEDGKAFVNVEGDITFQDKPVRAMVQFIVEGESFSFSAFEMNGVPSANLIAIGLLNKMCASAEGNVAEKTAILPQPDSAKSTAIEVLQPVPAAQPSQDTSRNPGLYEWKSGWGQGTTEYFAEDGNGNKLYIACPDSEGAVSAIATIGGVWFSSDEEKFDVIVDGETYNNPFQTDCRVCANNFEPFWAALRKANNIRVSAAGKSAVIPTNNIGKVLPAFSSKENSCRAAQ